MPVLIDNWHVTPVSPYDAPELRRNAICGIVTGHHAHADGSDVVTSRIVAVDGRFVTTASGTRYVLGDVSLEYREWLRRNVPDWDPANPIKDVT